MHPPEPTIERPAMLNHNEAACGRRPRPISHRTQICSILAVGPRYDLLPALLSLSYVPQNMRAVICPSAEAASSHNCSMSLRSPSSQLHLRHWGPSPDARLKKTPSLQDHLMLYPVAAYNVRHLSPGGD